LTTQKRPSGDAGRMAQFLAIAGLVVATIAMLGVIWALDKL
jgi:hypothetical protein